MFGLRKGVKVGEYYFGLLANKKIIAFIYHTHIMDMCVSDLHLLLLRHFYNYILWSTIFFFISRIKVARNIWSSNDIGFILNFHCLHFHGKDKSRMDSWWLVQNKWTEKIHRYFFAPTSFIHTSLIIKPALNRIAK